MSFEQELAQAIRERDEARAKLAALLAFILERRDLYATHAYMDVLAEAERLARP